MQLQSKSMLHNAKRIKLPVFKKHVQNDKSIMRKCGNI